MAKITVQDADITIISVREHDYISLTDMAKSQLQEHIIFRWLSLKSTIEYLGEWEILYNPDFNYTEFGTIKYGKPERRIYRTRYASERTPHQTQPNRHPTNARIGKVSLFVNPSA